MPRLTQDQWQQIRAEREAGATFRELAERFGVSDAAIVKRSKAEGWGDGTDVAEVIRRKVSEKVSGVVSSANPKRRAEAIDAAADRAAAVVERHKQDWDAHRARFGAVPEHFEDGKLAKITAEMLRIRHDGERRAWGLDEAAQAPTIEIVRSYGAGA